MPAPPRAEDIHVGFDGGFISSSYRSVITPKYSSGFTVGTFGKDAASVQLDCYGSAYLLIGYPADRRQCRDCKASFIVETDKAFLLSDELSAAHL